ncbi:MAG TPA: CoA transferase [Candidatus Methylomirabilis sp.]|jgi:crotonobetainyl-CoA:carnitine CoA-transferase CaiB-like acyl-CoA transferase|nr:CoA transferase [Candidatus Methylomirabilis sp.]
MADKRKPTIPVLPWPAVPTPTPDEVYKGESDKAKEYALYLESIVRQSENFKKPEALSTVRVLDCTANMIIGHWCSSLLSELGAEVIMVEPPGGDPLRKLTPFGRQEYMFEDNVTHEKVGARFLAEARSKQSITLNLESAEGREILKKLAVQADVLIENAPPGDYDAKGIGYRQLSELNPRLVYCWVGQLGQWGPLKDKPGNLDPTAQAACGFVHGTGAPSAFGGTPTRSGWWMCDQVGGTTAAIGIMAGLHYRERVSGRGQFVESTGAAGVIRILDYNWGWYGVDGSIRPRYGNWDLAINIYAVNPCKDGQIMVGGGHDRLWYRIWRTVGKDQPAVEQHIVEDPSLREVTGRLPHYKQVQTYTSLCEWMKDNTRSEAETKLQAEEVASGGVSFMDEVCEFPHYKYRGHMEIIDDNLYGSVLIGSSAFLGHRTPGRVKWIGRPTGFDNEDVYRRLLGLTKADMDGLKKKGVI